MDFKNTTVFHFEKIATSISKIAMKLLKTNLGITYGEFLVLMFLEGNENQSQKKIVDAMGLSKSVVSDRVKRLVESKYIKKIVNINEKREHLLSLTSEGKNILTNSYLILEEESKKIFEIPSIKDFKESLNIIEKNIKENFEEGD